MKYLPATQNERAMAFVKEMIKQVLWSDKQPQPVQASDDLVSRVASVLIENEKFIDEIATELYHIVKWQLGHPTIDT